MKTVEHIIWETSPYRGEIHGILQLTLFYHGGGHEHMIVEGTYVYQSYPESDYVDTKFGRFSKDTVEGVSGISIHKVGEIIYNVS